MNKSVNKGHIRRIVIVLLLLTFIGSLIMLLGMLKRYEDARLKNKQAQTYLNVPSGSGEQTFNQAETVSFVPPEVDFSSLQDINSEITAWLWVPQSAISYPVAHGDDNDKYLHTAFDGTKSFSGSIFMDFQNKNDFSDENTILYGHNMKDHSMFGTLKQYREQSYAESHSHIYVITPERTYVYKIFSVYDTETTDVCYTRNFENKVELAQEILRAQARSQVSLETDLQSIEQYLTLSTCSVSDEYRLVVQAYCFRTIDH